MIARMIARLIAALTPRALKNQARFDADLAEWMVEAPRREVRTAEHLETYEAET